MDRTLPAQAGRLVTPADFPGMFAEGWGLPKPDAFLAHFLPVIDTDATFRQPTFPDAHGLAQIEQMFRRFFVLFPDLTVTVCGFAIAGDIVFIESGCAATLGRTTVRFDVCDRFVIRNGKVVERRSFSDSLPVLLAVLARPASWPRAIRARTSRKPDQT